MSRLLADRRVQLLIAASFFAVALGFFALTSDQAVQVMIHAGYWIMLVITGLFVRALYRLARNDWPGWETWRSMSRWPAWLVVGCGGVLLVHESYGFKILMDEVMLLGTSMSMHFEKVALVPMRGHDIQGAFQILGGQLDKRPLFQPFLVSVLHDLTGYRPENVFVLNTALIFVLLGLVYRTGRLIAGAGAGAAGVLMVTSVPLVAQNAKGGGFELLNLVMILSTVLLAVRYARRADRDSLDALLLSAVLLALTRYESVLFILPVGLLIVWVWWREKNMEFSLLFACGPLLLVPYALHNQVFKARASSWEMASQPGYEQPFSLSFFPDNVAHALNFFFSTTGEHSNSLVLSALGIAALPFFVLLVVKTLLRAKSQPVERVALAIMALGFFGHTLLLLCYFWGRFDDPVIRRLSLPLHLLLVISILAVAAEFPGRFWRWRALAVVTGAGIFAFSLPAMARHDYTLDYYVGREMEWRREFIAAHPEKDYLFIDNNCIIWVVHLVSGTPVTQVLEHKDNIIFNLQNKLFTAIYVFQRLTIDPVTGAARVQTEDELGPDFVLETVLERRFTPLTVSRISRLTSIKPGPVTLPPRPSVSLERMSGEERERIRQAYMENFIKRLP